MNFTLIVIDVRGKGVQCATPDSTGEAFWLPKAAVQWSAPPEPGMKISVSIPHWLAKHHGQLVHLRGQYAFPLNPMPGLGPEASRAGSFPMSDFPPDAGKGALYRNSKATKPSHPSHTGFCDLNGLRYRVVAWVRVNEQTGEKFFSMTFRDAGEKAPERQQKAAAGQSFNDDPDSIPF